jgi:hypothetical protein
MADNNIPIKILNTIQEVGAETVEEGIKTTEQAISTVITGQELVGDVKPMGEEEMAKAKAEDERKKQEEFAKLQNIPGRNVEEEIIEVVKEKENEEEKKQREFLENIERQRQEEEMERNNLITEPGNAKREAAKTQFSPGKRKKQEPNMTQMSQTSEFKGGKID